jgi:hypothetical protein
MAHDQEVVGSNPGTLYWLDVSGNASYYVKEKFENKGIQMEQNVQNMYFTFLLVLNFIFWFAPFGFH